MSGHGHLGDQRAGLAVAGGSWFFLTVPEGSDEIAEVSAGTEGCFGSVRVEVSCAETNWRTSLFPSTSAQAYVLPLKRSVRRAERLSEGGTAYVRLRLLGGRDVSD